MNSRAVIFDRGAGPLVEAELRSRNPDLLGHVLNHVVRQL
jgi:hypothetical protein